MNLSMKKCLENRIRGRQKQLELITITKNSWKEKYDKHEITHTIYDVKKRQLDCRESAICEVICELRDLLDMLIDGEIR